LLLIELESKKIIDCQYQDVNFIPNSTVVNSPDQLVNHNSISIDLTMSSNNPTLLTDVPTDLPAADSNSEDLKFEDAQDSHSFPDELDELSSADGEQPVEAPGTSADSPRLPSGMSPQVSASSLTTEVQNTSHSPPNTTISRKSPPSSTSYLYPLQKEPIL
jgi:hypothetical protein